MTTQVTSRSGVFIIQHIRENYPRKSKVVLGVFNIIILGPGHSEWVFYLQKIYINELYLSSFAGKLLRIYNQDIIICRLRHPLILTFNFGTQA